MQRAGLCFMGISAKHVLKTFGPYDDIKVRYVLSSYSTPFNFATISFSGYQLTILLPSFAGVVYPGETLITEMWKEGNKVLFSTFFRSSYPSFTQYISCYVATKVKERGTTALAAAAVTLAASTGTAKAKL